MRAEIILTHSPLSEDALVQRLESAFRPNTPPGQERDDVFRESQIFNDLDRYRDRVQYAVSEGNYLLFGKRIQPRQSQFVVDQPNVLDARGLCSGIWMGLKDTLNDHDPRLESFVLVEDTGRQIDRARDPNFASQLGREGAVAVALGLIGLAWWPIATATTSLTGAETFTAVLPLVAAAILWAIVVLIDTRRKGLVWSA